MNKANQVEGVIQGFNSKGNTAIIGGISYGCFDPAYWKGAKEGDKVSFDWQPSKCGKWRNVQQGTVIVYKKQSTEVSREDRLETRKLALRCASNLNVEEVGSVLTAAKEYEKYLLGEDLMVKEKKANTIVDSGFGIED